MSGPYAPGTPPPYYPMQQPPTPRGGGFGTAALILGIIAVVFSFVPVILHLGFILAVLALVFGIIALRRRIGKGMAGTVLGGVGIVLALTFGTVYGIGTSAPDTAPVQAADATDDGTDKVSVEVPDVVGMSVEEATGALEDAGFASDDSGADAADTVASQSPAAGSAVDKGSTVELTAAVADGSSATQPAPAGSKFDMTNTNRLDGTESDYTQWIDGYNDSFTSSNEYEQPAANMKYVLLTVHVTATTSGVDASSAAYDVALAGTDGSVYESEYLSDVKSMPSVTLGEGQSATGKIAFEVPNTFHGGIVSFGDGSVFVKTN